MILSETEKSLQRNIFSKTHSHLKTTYSHDLKLIKSFFFVQKHKAIKHSIYACIEHINKNPGYIIESHLNSIAQLLIKQCYFDFFFAFTIVLQKKKVQKQ